MKCIKKHVYYLKTVCVHGRLLFVKYPNVENVGFSSFRMVEAALLSLTHESFESEIEP